MLTITTFNMGQVPIHVGLFASETVPCAEDKQWMRLRKYDMLTDGRLHITDREIDGTKLDEKIDAAAPRTPISELDR
jgi:hypothetical protein